MVRSITRIPQRWGFLVFAALAVLLTNGETASAQEKLLVSDATRGFFELEPSGPTLTPIDTGTTFTEPGHFDFDAEGDAIVTDCDAAQVVRLDPATGDTTVISSGNLLGCPQAITVLQDGTPARRRGGRLFS